MPFAPLDDIPRWLRVLDDLPELTPAAHEWPGNEAHRVSRLPATLAAARGTFDCSRRAPASFEPAACTDDATYR
jgi:hypothetical protein